MSEKLPWVTFPHLIEDGGEWLSLSIFGLVDRALLAVPLGGPKSSGASS